MKKIDDAKQFGRDIAVAVFKDYKNGEFGKNSDIEWVVSWTCSYTRIQTGLTFGPPFPVKKMYINAAVKEAREKLNLLIEKDKE
jgi:hypothetical protein